MGGQLSNPTSTKVVMMNTVTGLPDTDDNGHNVVAGTPFTGDIIFDGNITEIAGAAIAYTAGTAGKMPVAFFDAAGNAFGTSGNPVIVQSPAGGENVNVTNVDGDIVWTSGTPITAGQPAIQTLAVNYVTKVSDGSADALTGEFVGSSITADGATEFGMVNNSVVYGYVAGDSFAEMVNAQPIGTELGGGEIGLVTFSATADGAGKPIYGVQYGFNSIPTNDYVLGMAAALYGQDVGNQNGYAVNVATPGDWFANNSTPTSGLGIWTVTSLDAQGGVSLSPAQTLFSGIATTVEGAVVGSVINGFSHADGTGYVFTGTYNGDGDTANDQFALSTATWFHGGSPVAPADSNGDIPVNTGSAFNGNTFAAPGTLALNAGRVVENYTVTADWVGSLGADTFTATLEGSTTGAFGGEQRILGTITEATGGLTLSVTSKPWPYTRVNLSALSLDTATGLVLNGVAK